MTYKYSEHENLIIQTYMNFIWLKEMHDNDFHKSEFYKNMNFNDKFTQNTISERGIINQGIIPVAFYTMLIIPKETIFKDYKEDYDKINKHISENLRPESQTTYNKDKDGIDYLRHLRNAFSHMNFDMTSISNAIIFKDWNSHTNEEFSCTLTNWNLGQIIDELAKVHRKYICSIQEKQRKNFADKEGSESV